MSVLYSPIIQAILSARSLGFELIDVIQDLLNHILSTAMETASKETSRSFKEVYQCVILMLYEFKYLQAFV